MTAIGEIAVFTDDVHGAAAFYRQVTGAAAIAEWPGGVLFAIGDVKLLVHARGAALEDGPPNEDHVAVGVEDLEAVCEALTKAGVTFLVEPRDYAWGRSAYLRDPDGRLVELAQA